MQRAWSRVADPHRLFRVKDGEEAKEFLAGRGRFSHRQGQANPKLVLSDLKMPLCDGIELLRWLRQQPELQNLPFVIISSSPAESDIQAARQAGANDYLVKPSRVDQFKDILEAVRPYWIDSQ